MTLFAQIMPNAAKATGIFAIAACFLSVVTEGTADRILVRLITEFPLLVLLSFVGAVVITTLAGMGGTILGSSKPVAALLAAILGWAVAGGGPASFAGLGYSALLQPAYAIAVAAPWLLSAVSRRI